MMMVPGVKPNGTPLKNLLYGLVDASVIPDVDVSGINMDSRKIIEGDLFLACYGYETNGTSYITDAIDSGAVAIAVEAEEFPNLPQYPLAVVPVQSLSRNAGRIAERYYGNPTNYLDVVGVTGTNGKTSITYFLTQALSGHEKKTPGIIGTLGYGSLHQLQTGMHTTPDAISLHQHFDEMRQAGINTVFMEVSSHALEQGRCSGVNFKIGVFTNLSRDHLDYHKNMQEYAAAKEKFFLEHQINTAVINIDSDFGYELSKKLTGKLDVITYGLKTGKYGAADINATINIDRLGHLEFAVNSPWGHGEISTTLSGSFNACNLSACLGVMCILDIPIEEGLTRLKDANYVPGRMERFGSVNTPSVIVDYSHTPDALEQALQSISKYRQENGQIICVFGCGGDRDKGKRPQMGRIAEQYADMVVVTSDNPRSESPDEIINQIIAGIKNPAEVITQVDRANAIETTIRNATDKDIVLIAGKGHETYQEISGKRYPFSDRQLVRNILELKA